MGFRNDSFAKVWGVEDKGNYSVVALGISKKDKDTGEYKEEFNNKFVRFIGKAHNIVKKLDKGASIKLLNVDVTSVYDKDKKQQYTNFLVFDCEVPSGNNTSSNTSKPAPSQTSSSGHMNIPSSVDDDELPFN